jgi:hypothetical protein
MSLAPKAGMAVFIAPFPKTKIEAAELRMSGSCSLLVLRINFLLSARSYRGLDQHVRSTQRSELLLVGFETLLRRPFRDPSGNEIVAHESAGLHSERYEAAGAYVYGARRARIFPADFVRR